MGDEVYIRIPPQSVNYVNRILEGYEYLGILTTINAKRATCVIHATADTRSDVLQVLSDIDGVSVEILKDREEAL